MRHTGPSMSPFTAWVALKGLDTMSLRVQQMQESALRLATWLEQRPEVSWVRYPFLASHPQHDLARRQMTGGGTVVTFELADVPGRTGREAAFAVLDGMRLIDISNNLGDSKSLVTHPATTTHRRMGPEGRAAVGITDSVVRISVGLEDAADLLDDVELGLQALA